MKSNIKDKNKTDNIKSDENISELTINHIGFPEDEEYWDYLFQSALEYKNDLEFNE